MQAGNAPVIYSNNAKAFTVAAATGSIAIWRLTGHIWVKKLYGIVETVLSANITAAHFRINDQTAQPVLTAAAGTVLSAMAVGRMFSKRDLAAVALTADGGLTNVGSIFEPAVKETDTFSEFGLIKKTAANTDIEFRYTTTDNPSTGNVRFYIEWLPLSLDGNLAAL
jgi:hypothetical protein